MTTDGENIKFIGGAIATLSSTILGGLAWLFKKQGALAVTVKKNTKEIDEIQGRFVTENNEPALMSYRAHRHICEQNSQLLLARFEHVVGTVEEQKKDMKDISERMGDVVTGLAVLEGKIK